MSIGELGGEREESDEREESEASDCGVSWERLEALTGANGSDVNTPPSRPDTSSGGR